MALSKRSTLDVALAGGRLGAPPETAGTIARRRGAMAAINGGFGKERPAHVFAEDGHLVQTVPYASDNFAVSRDETKAFIGRAHPETRIIDPREPLRLRQGWRVNWGSPSLTGTSITTPAGGTLESPPRRACSARLMARSRPEGAPTVAHVSAIHEVQTVVCRRERLRRAGGKVFSALRGGKRVDAVRSLEPGDKVSYDWTIGWPHVFDSIGGFPTLMLDGRVLWERLKATNPWFYRRHPRTGVGYDEDHHRVLLVTVDGRQPGWSVGMTLGRFARLFRSLGAEKALNLDGGGSTVMWVGGRVVNRPSDGAPRPNDTAVLVLPGADGGERFNNREFSMAAGAAGSIVDRSTELQEMSDPASTGGLAASLVQRGAALSPDMQQAGSVFLRNRPAVKEEAANLSPGAP